MDRKYFVRFSFHNGLEYERFRTWLRTWYSDRRYFEASSTKTLAYICYMKLTKWELEDVLDTIYPIRSYTVGNTKQEIVDKANELWRAKGEIL